MKEGSMTLPEDIVILQTKSRQGKEVFVGELPLRRIPESQIPTIKKYIEHLRKWRQKGNTERACFEQFFYGKHDQFSVSYAVLLRDSNRARQASD